MFDAVPGYLSSLLGRVRYRPLSTDCYIHPAGCLFVQFGVRQGSCTAIQVCSLCWASSDVSGMPTMHACDHALISAYGSLSLDRAGAHCMDTHDIRNEQGLGID